MSETSPTPPRRFRFGLRTLFVLVTVMALASAWAGYALNWIKQRREFRSLSLPVVSGYTGYGERPAPGGLWLFGETGIGIIFCEVDADADSLGHIRRLFPESLVITVDQEIPPEFRY